MNIIRPVLDDINNQTTAMLWTCSENGRGEIAPPQKKLWNGAHQEEENEVDLKLHGLEGLEDCWGEKVLIEEDRNGRDNWKKKIR